MAAVVPRFGALDMVRRHWDHTPHEVRPMDMQTFHAPGTDLSRLPTTAGLLSSTSSSLDRRFGGFAPLPSTGASGRPFDLPAEAVLSGGRTRRIVMPGPLDDGKLGLAIKDAEVVAITNRAAASYGWAVGDRVLSINGISVHGQDEFVRVMHRILDEYSHRRTPLTFEVTHVHSALRRSPHDHDHDDCCGGPHPKEAHLQDLHAEDFRRPTPAARATSRRRGEADDCCGPPPEKEAFLDPAWGHDEHAYGYGYGTGVDLRYSTHHLDHLDHRFPAEVHRRRRNDCVC